MKSAPGGATQVTMKAPSSFSLSSYFLVFVALACGSGSDADSLSSGQQACAPGEALECACMAGAMGTQTCADDGASVGPCSCEIDIVGTGSVPNTGAVGGVGNTGNVGGTGNTGNFGGTGNTGNVGGTGNTGNVGGTGNTGNVGGTGNTGNVGGTGNTGNVGGTGSVGGTGGDPGVCCSNGDCLCHGPAPTEASATANGQYLVEQYTNGFSDKPGYLAGTIYYPTNGEPPLAGVVICPGWTAVQSSIAGWGPFLASHGIVLMTIDTNTTGDSVVQRSVALMDALASLKEENTRPGSPLQGKLSADRYGLMGWSMGGGATWINAAQHPELKTGISLAGHSATAGGAAIAAGTVVPSMMFAGATDTPILGGGGQSQAVYDIIPATTPKILYEMAAEGHFSWGTPTLTNGGALGRYGLAFQKVFLEGDERYRSLLLIQGPGASDWRSTVY